MWALSDQKKLLGISNDVSLHITREWCIIAVTRCTENQIQLFIIRNQIVSLLDEVALSTFCFHNRTVAAGILSTVCWIEELSIAAHTSSSSLTRVPGTQHECNIFNASQTKCNRIGVTNRCKIAARPLRPGNLLSSGSGKIFEQMHSRIKYSKRKYTSTVRVTAGLAGTRSE
jgi:hypothetical protein